MNAEQLPLMPEKEPSSWLDVKEAFFNSKVAKSFERLERTFGSKVEISAFAKLVNTSISSKQPFHRWVRYREGYAGDLVKEILRRYPVRIGKDYVVDPMSGSGSTLIACKEVGIDSIGLDVNPFAVLAGNVKGVRYSKKALSDILQVFEAVIKLPLKTGPFNNSNYLAKYFPSKNYKVLVSIKKRLEEVRKGFVKDFVKLALLSILEDCSNRKKDGNGLATRPAPCSDPVARLSEQIQMMIYDVECSNHPSCTSICFDQSATQLYPFLRNYSKKKEMSIGGFIFSPPYANSFDYFESYKLEILFGDYFSIEDFQDARSRLIRNFRLGKTQSESRFKLVEDLCSEVSKAIIRKEKMTGIRDGRTRLVPNMLRAYFEDMAQVIEGTYKTLRKGCSTHIVIDQSAYAGIPIPTDLIFAEIGQQIGFNVEEIIECRRANTSGQQLKVFPYLKTMLRESIVSLVK